MLWLYIFTEKIMKRSFLLFFYLCCLFNIGTHVYADSFESLIMPGPVIKGHAKFEQECEKCHNVFDKKDQNKLCLSCHKDVRKDINDNEGYHGKYKIIKKTECYSCHIEHKGRSADIVKLDNKTFQHDLTDFKLKHAHKNVKCSSCHLKEKKHREAKHQCSNCHKDNDTHKGELGNKCNSCHNEKSWSDISFDHDKTDFSLTGKHAKTSCNSCHINNKYEKTPKKCNTCHAIDDVHKGKNGKNCKKCHNSRNWKSLKFDHDKDTKFKLTGRHKNQNCKSCHLKNPYKVKIKKDCISCHLADDKHKNNYGKNCQHCHSTKKWSKITFNHKRDTKYVLTGKHKSVKCNSCHTGIISKQKLSTKCYSCHKLDDVHKSKTESNCNKCHSTQSWHLKIQFDHDLTLFPLLGLHAITACNDCHQNQQYANTSKDCASCHKKDDVHKQKLGTACEQCHTPNDWKVWQFDHEKETTFILDGAHEKIHCHSCHQEPAKNGIETGQTCGSCHNDDDVHNNQFGQRCEQCHNTSNFNHVDMTDL